MADLDFLVCPESLPTLHGPQISLGYEPLSDPADLSLGQIPPSRAYVNDQIISGYGLEAYWRLGFMNH